MKRSKKYNVGTRESVQVSEPIVAYESHLEDRQWIVQESVAGVPAPVIDDFIRMGSLTREFFANLFDISTRTLDRYTLQNRKLNPVNSELLLKLLGVYRKGKEVFGSRESFRRWLDLPAPGLMNQKPLDIMRTSTGMDLVTEELIRIENGYPV